ECPLKEDSSSGTFVSKSTYRVFRRAGDGLQAWVQPTFRIDDDGGTHMPFCASVIMLLAAAAGEIATTIVQAPDSPVRLANARIRPGSAAPPVLLYSATNVTDQALDQFTVMAFVFDAQGRLKARQVAPGRRTLEPRATKYSAMVLDGSPI